MPAHPGFDEHQASRAALTQKDTKRNRHTGGQAVFARRARHASDK